MPENDNEKPDAAPDASPDATSVEAEPTATHEPTPAPAEPTDTASRRPLPGWATSRTALAAAAAVGVFLVGGLSGFAIGHATADDGRGDRFAPVGFRDGGPGDQDRGWDGGGRGPSFRGPDGQLPPSTEGESQSESDSGTNDSGTSS